MAQMTEHLLWKNKMKQWGEGKIKANDEEGEFNYDVRTFVNVTMYPQYNDMVIKC
jgi:hypothetical protein